MHYGRSTEAPRRLVRTAAIRAVLCVFVAGVIRLNRPPAGGVEGLLPYFLVAAAFAFNFLFLGLGRRAALVKCVEAAAIWLDVAFVTGLVYLTGGVGSDFLLLYFGPILAAGVLLRRGAALLVGSLSTIGLFLCVALYYSAAAGGPPWVEQVWVAEGRPDPGALVGTLTLQGAAFHLVAYLSATLALRLHSASIHTEQILENMSDGVVTVDSTGRVVFSNSNARSMLETPGEELLGVPFWDIAPPPARDALHEVLRGSRQESVEVNLGRGRTPAMISVLPLAGQKGRLRGANVILHDLTERRRLTEALRRAERLEATSATVASIAHEIRNPLAAIRGGAQELKKALKLSGPDRGLMDLIINESDRLNRIITDFLNFSRIRKPRLAPTDLRRLLDEVAAQLRSAPSPHAHVRVEGPGELWLNADAEQLHQVFLNLGLNALDATEGRGPVLLRLCSGPEGAEVKTLDRGPGIDDSLVERIFEPFFTTKTTGTGLGLPIARRIVEDHEGRLEVGGGEDGWTCMKVFLPFIETRAKERQSEPRAKVA